MSRSLLVAAFVFFGLLAMPVGALAVTPRQIMEANRDAVVYIKVTGTDRNGVPLKVSATGFLVSIEGHLLTADHILREGDDRPIEGLEIEGSMGSRFEYLRPIEILGRDADAGLMLLKFRGNRSDYQVVRVCREATLESGEELVAIGFPKGSELSVIDGLLSNKSAEGGRYQTNLAVMEGYSGGPVFDVATGSVVGIVMSGTPGVAGRNFFAPIDDAHALLARVPGKRASRCDEVIGTLAGDDKFADSDVRLAKLVDAADAWAAAPGPSSLRALGEAYAAITRFDQQRFQPQYAAAYETGLRGHRILNARELLADEVTRMLVPIYVTGHDEEVEPAVSPVSFRALLSKNGFSVSQSRTYAGVTIHLEGRVENVAPVRYGTRRLRVGEDPLHGALTQLSITATWERDGQIFFTANDMGNGAAQSATLAMIGAYRRGAQQLFDVFFEYVLAMPDGVKARDSAKGYFKSSREETQ